MSPKLVRDRIPEIIESSGRHPTTRQAHQAERGDLLAQKLIEEANEFFASRSAEELADVLEVIYALAANLGISVEIVEAKRREKLAQRGGFDAGFVLLEIRKTQAA